MAGTEGERRSCWTGDPAVSHREAGASATASIPDAPAPALVPGGGIAVSPQGTALILHDSPTAPSGLLPSLEGNRTAALGTTTGAAASLAQQQAWRHGMPHLQWWPFPASLALGPLRPAMEAALAVASLVHETSATIVPSRSAAQSVVTPARYGDWEAWT